MRFLNKGTVILIPVILPGSDKLSRVSDENLTFLKHKTHHHKTKPTSFPPQHHVPASPNPQFSRFNKTTCTQTPSYNLQTLWYVQPLRATEGSRPSLTASELQSSLAPLRTPRVDSHWAPLCQLPGLKTWCEPKKWPREPAWKLEL